MPALTPDQLIAAGPTPNAQPNVRATNEVPPIGDSNIKVIEPNTTKQEVAKVDDEDAKFDFTKFEEKKRDTELPKKVEEKKEEVKPAPEQKKEELPPEKEEEDDTPLTAKPIRPKPPLAEQLKEEGLDQAPEELKSMFKHMGKPAREWAMARYKEIAELKKQAAEGQANKIPQQWFDHEEAYVLHPAYRQSAQIAQNAQGYVQFWTEQLSKIKEGEKWLDLVPDGKGGLTTVERDPGPQAEIYVNDQRLLEQSALQKHMNIAEGIRNSFGRERGQVAMAIKETEKKFFPQYEDPKTYEEASKAVTGVLEKFNQRGNVLASFLTKLYAFAGEQAKTISELEQQLAGKTVAAKEKKSNGPSYEELEAGKAKVITDPDDKPFDITEFMKRKAS